MQEYKYLIVPIITLVIAQLIKFVIESIINKRFNWGRLVNGAGGMPSSHSSFSFSLTMMIGLNEGFNTPLFAIALVFSLIVAYDAMGLRMESGKHAQALNRIGNEIFSKNYKSGIAKLKEELGHNPLEVLGGIILAIIVSIILNRLI